MKALPPDFLATLGLPVQHEDDLDAQATFFDRDAVSDFYRATVKEGTGDEVLEAATALLPDLHPLRAALFAILCGGLVENGADPRLLFPAALRRLARLLESLAPYCAAEPMEDDEEEASEEEPADVLAWRAAEAALEALPPAERLQVEASRQAVDLLVLPLMAMLMRDVRNHRELLADEALCARIEALSVNGTLPFEELHFLHRTAQMAYEDELVVLLPASNAGMIVRAHGINNNFHAFSLLQDLFSVHAKTLASGSRWPIVSVPTTSRATAIRRSTSGCRPRPTPVVNSSTAWPGPGARTLRENARRQGRLVLVALETEDKPRAAGTVSTRPSIRSRSHR